MGRFIFEVSSIDQVGGKSKKTSNSAADFFARALWQNAYVCGIEGVPFQTDVQLHGNRLVLERGIDASAKLLIPYHIDGIGYRTMTTCSLRPCIDDEAYDLPLELARGSCMMARNQSDLWQRSGLKVDSEFVQKLKLGTEQFIESAIASDRSLSLRKAIASIKTLQTAIDLLNHQYALQSIAYRTSCGSPIGTMVGAVTIPPQPAAGTQWSSYQKMMNCIAIRTSWADIQSDPGEFHFDALDSAMARAADQSMRIIAGPIIDFRQRLMPHWIYQVENDFDELTRSVVRFVEQVVSRYAGRVTLWNAASALNTPGPLPLSDEQAMRLTVDILQAVRRADPNAAMVVSFDQPCGEYMASNHDSISPMHFADAISRSGLGLSGLGLEYRIGYKEDSTLPRSSLEIGNSVDRWATLGMPLMVTIVAPGDHGIDANAIAPSTQWQMPNGKSPSKLDSDAQQLRVGGSLLRTMLAKPSVHGILWDGWDDSQTHVHSHSGLMDHAGRPRRLCDYIERLKRDGVIGGN